MSDDYVQLFVFVLYWLRMKLYGFANFVEQHLVLYKYTSKCTCPIVQVHAYTRLPKLLVYLVCST